MFWLVGSVLFYIRVVSSSNKDQRQCRSTTYRSVRSLAGSTKQTPSAGIREPLSFTSALHRRQRALAPCAATEAGALFIYLFAMEAGALLTSATPLLALHFAVLQTNRTFLSRSAIKVPARRAFVITSTFSFGFSLGVIGSIGALCQCQVDALSLARKRWCCA